jgi:hypothetical protein
MININTGDYILGKDEIWEITNIYQSGQDTLFNLRLLSEPGDFLEVYDHELAEYKGAEPVDRLVGVSFSYIKHLGQIVPKDSQKAVEILFKDNK